MKPLVLAGLGCFLLLSMAMAALFFLGPGYARQWAESEAGRNAASRGLSKTIKVDGNFQPLHLDGWTVTTDGFVSAGWPGEAIGSLNCGPLRAEFDPWAILRGAWRIKYVQVDHATIELRKPNDSLKRPVPPKKSRPWYAFLLPSRFDCGPIRTPHATLLYSFQGQTARIHDAQVQADLIGKDLKYTATSGVMEMPYFPPLRINRLEMLVTRPSITVYTAQLAGLDPSDPARVTLSGTLGMRENRAIDAKADVTEMPIKQILPENLRGLVRGRASGKLVWKRDFTGKALDSDGELTLDGAGIDHLSVFTQLAILHGNPDLDDFRFDQATCQFHLHGGRIDLELRAHSPDKFTLVGKVGYQFDGKWADLDLTVTDLPFQTWLPSEFKPGASGAAHAQLQWHGRFETIKDSSGKVSLNFDGGTLGTPAILRHLLASHRLRSPEVIQFKTAQLDFTYQEQTFQLTRGDLDLPGIVTAHLDGTLSSENRLRARIQWQGLTIQDWLPPELAGDFSGAIAGRAQMEMHHWKLEDGSYGGDMRLTRGELRYTSFQSLLARFLNDRELLELPLTRATFSWLWNHGNLTVRDIDLRGGERLGVKGAFSVDAGKNLSGVLRVGTRADYLPALSGLGDTVFSRREDGLRWARVTLSGTVKKPKQDLSAQIIGQLGRHPTALFSLGFKLASWYVGDLFGAQKDWQRVPAGSEKGLERK